MKYLIAVALLLAGLPAAAEEQITCAELATRSDRLVAKLSKEINEKEAAGDKVGVSLRKTTIGIQGKHFRESCVEPFVCDEAVDQLNTGKLPAAYKNSFTGILAYLEKTCSG